MTRYLLDTNVVSDVVKPDPPPALLAWMGDRADEELFVSALTLAEIARGVLEKPAGRRRRELERWFSGPDGPAALFAGRILPFDAAAALIWARLMAEGSEAGAPRSALDMVVAATAEANGCVLATANERHFRGIDFVNPSRRAD